MVELINLRSVLAVVSLLNKSGFLTSESFLILVMSCIRQFKKVLGQFALSTFFVSGLSSATWASEACGFLELVQGLPVKVARVIDGDTIVLVGGERVRLAGINAPELGRRGRSHQPLAPEAKSALTRFLNAHKTWYLLPALSQFEAVTPAVSRDRYGRLLGHLYSGSGNSAELHLLGLGLAFAVAVDTDVHMACFQGREAGAKDSQKGVWSLPYWQPLVAAQVSDEHLGFGLFKGVITRTVDRGKFLYVEVDDRITLQLSHTAKKVFTERKLIGRAVSFSGWLSKRSTILRPDEKARVSYALSLKSRYMVSLD